MSQHTWSNGGSVVMTDSVECYMALPFPIAYIYIYTVDDKL
jgi:hypothetical protein